MRVWVGVLACALAAGCVEPSPEGVWSGEGELPFYPDSVVPAVFELSVAEGLESKREDGDEDFPVLLDVSWGQGRGTTWDGMLTTMTETDGIVVGLSRGGVEGLCPPSFTVGLDTWDSLNMGSLSPSGGEMEIEHGSGPCGAFGRLSLVLHKQ